MFSIYVEFFLFFGGLTLPHMPILGSSNSAANKNMMSKIWTNGVQLSDLSRKHCGKRRNWRKGEIARYEQFILFPQCFQKVADDQCW